MKAFVTGVASFLLLFFNTVIFVIPLMFIALVKVLLRIGPIQHACSLSLTWIAETWATINKLIFATTTNTVWDVRGLGDLDKKHSYLVLANHQSWVDIPALLQTFTGRAPFFKFFLKKELIWVPLLGLAWWALDYPFVRRYGKEFLKQNPHLKGKDLELTRKACEKFKTQPVSVMNFVEGTRFRADKHQKTQSPYRTLLKPKSGGIAFVLAAMGGQFESILDVSIAYRDGEVPSFIDMLCGRIDRVIIDIQHKPIPAYICAGDYSEDKAFRVEFQSWLNEIWQQKDERLITLRQELN
ncbi:1-acyl-sn-glycerol-3-phosphate acyltransferase [Sinobacterium caligoides]|uniref:1-acyl-sn-glycerol-3-phosphate acyltransferase n=1 Tax=Sinobacterium caligoides TaxID=933926 RepID=A0A3N2DNP9_9GAMM|nr:acyltransferase [Sinobacterium caligoides]ROS01433.1 1-acyl-sn-glycerol-3-phosphate acyltransferase [Sinobacterium caligoides]